jgi:Tfp pilus assembly protein PilZ
VSGEAGSGSERRRADRVAMPAGGPVSVVGAKLTSVSPFGMRIESPVVIAVGAVLPFRLSIAGEKADVDAQVASCTPSGGERRGYDIGLEFIEMPSAVRERLREVLHRYSEGRQS